MAAMKSSASISEFLLDSRTPTFGTSSNYDAEEAAREKEVEKKVEDLIKEAKLWRIANSAQWVAWGIVQAKVPGLDNKPQELKSEGPVHHIKDKIVAKVGSVLHKAEPMTDPQTPEAKQHQESHDHDQRPEEGHGEDEDEFDYLGYAQQRAMFFWGDVVDLGLVKIEDLPEGLEAKLKVVQY
jgi:choline kinase